ncbi:hypothetical protein BC936DRAFT_147748 [Jimgerdemannia flammicorona]|uniref:Uncharacterized protein n=1 Tax=Jimgerdemannia flammicorona TaxID=994334 RepID=A0A433DL43_9FUNG|nr:hypothetical protein BC936DRAFT_147748 [Jimgerdemannia flammicorona]
MATVVIFQGGINQSTWIPSDGSLSPLRQFRIAKQEKARDTRLRAPTLHRETESFRLPLGAEGNNLKRHNTL